MVRRLTNSMISSRDATAESPNDDHAVGSNFPPDEQTVNCYQCTDRDCLGDYTHFEQPV